MTGLKLAIFGLGCVATGVVVGILIVFLALTALIRAGLSGRR